MENISLRIDAEGIFPNYGDTPRSVELRARAFLAHAHTLEKTVLIRESFAEFDAILLTLHGTEEGLSASEVMEVMKASPNTGLIYTKPLGSSWEEQPGRLLLFVEKTAQVDLLINFYFEAPLRWLDDKGYVKAQIEKALMKRNGNGVPA